MSASGEIVVGLPSARDPEVKGGTQGRGHGPGPPRSMAVENGSSNSRRTWPRTPRSRPRLLAPRRVSHRRRSSSLGVPAIARLAPRARSSSLRRR